MAVPYSNVIGELAIALRALWVGRPDWTDLGEFDTIGGVANHAFWAGGLLIRQAPNNGAHIRVWEPEEVDPHAIDLARSWAGEVEIN